MEKERYTVFARKYRAKDFDEIVGQEHVVKTLKNAIIAGNISHAYLFAGPRGVGKTSMARILAKSLNCENGPTLKPCNVCSSCVTISNGTAIDVVEMDGASHRKIDDIRKVIEQLKFPPMGGKEKWKIYIIDEVHMLTNEAFNALLKSLEEPPDHVIFIFATTEPYKVPETILSRCQRFDFRRIPLDKIENKLREIGKIEKIKAEDEIYAYIAMQAEGSLRDAEVMLDQIISFTDGKITLKIIQDFLGVIGIDWILRLIDSIYKRDTVASIEIINEVNNQGLSLVDFVLTILKVLRDLLIFSKKKNKLTSIFYYPYDSYMKNCELIEQFKEKDIIKTFMRIVEETYNNIRFTQHALLNVEVMVVKMIHIMEVFSIDELISLAEASKIRAKHSPNKVENDAEESIPEKLINKDSFDGFVKYEENTNDKFFKEFLEGYKFDEFMNDKISIYFENITNLDFKTREGKDYSPVLEKIRAFFNNNKLNLTIVWSKCKIKEAKNLQSSLKEDIMNNFPEIGKIVNAFNADVKKDEKENE
ncbi:DNA polymerase III subunit gamma/tau [bacterium]|nr:DNA polymerase III subunit gamma/tau [bacterium]